MQKSNMPANFSDMALPAQRHAGAASGSEGNALPNWAVESVNAPVRFGTRRKRACRPSSPDMTLPAATRTVSLVVNGKTIATQRRERSRQWPRHRRIRIARRALRFQPLRSPDRFGRYASRRRRNPFCVERSDPGQVLFVHDSGDTRSPLYFGSALGGRGQSAFRWKASARPCRAETFRFRSTRSWFFRRVPARFA